MITRAKTIKGLTLIEMVAIIVVLGAAMPPLLTMWADVGWRSARSEAIADATFYAQQLMEEIKSKRFDENTASPWSPALGVDSGETYPDYDDVDDFSGYADAPAAGYSRCVTVDYVTLSGSAWAGTCSPANPTDCNPPACVAADVTDYKRIIVRVSRADNLVSDVSLVTMVAAY